MIGQSVGPYRVLHELGAGGMGQVYLAEDDRLGRRVALKCPSDDWLQNTDAVLRLQREARAAARLNHPNIATIYDVLDHDGRPFIVMEYVEGETLAAALGHGRVTLERALAIAAQLTDGLAAAHAVGVIHRDLKPGNVMLTPDGQVKILDFGLARTADADVRALHLTQPGQILGTPGYVAPEQLLGREADARSDIYSAGAILYELLSGRTPWHDAAAGARGLNALLAPIPDLRSVDPSIPPPIAGVVMRALSREPADRFPSALAFKQAITGAASAVAQMETGPVPVAPPSRARIYRWIVPAAAVLLVLLAGIPFLLRGRSAPVSPSGTVPVIAVMPFDTLLEDARFRHIGTGMAETISTKLSTVAGVSVVPRMELTEAIQRNKDVARLSRALGATTVVSGTVQQSGRQLQVTITLVTADGRRIVSGDIYEDSVDHLFVLQRRIAEGLARRLVGTLSGSDSAHLEHDATASVQAMSAYWRGRELMEKPVPEPIDDAVAAFEESVREDPRFAAGLAALANAYWRKYELSRDRQWTSKAMDAAERARRTDPEQADVRCALATVFRGVGRTDEAIAELKHAIQLQPAADTAHRMLGEIYAGRGQTQDALAEYGEALRLRPDYWATHRAIGVVQLNAGHYPDAMRAFQRITELQPDSPVGWQLQGRVHAAMQDLDAAIADFEASIARGGTPATYSALGTVYYMRGRFEEAARAYEEAIKRRPNSALTHWNLGDAYRRVGRDGQARASYARAAALYEADLAVNPKDAEALATHATCLARLGQTRKALDELDRAVKLAPGDQNVQYQRALVLALTGRRDAAIDAVARAVAAGYSVQLLREDADLASLRKSPRFQSIVEGASSGVATGGRESPRRSR